MIGWLVLGWSTAVAVVSAVAILRWIRQARRDRRRVFAVPSSSVELVRPCAGREPHLLDNLCSTGALHTKHELGVTFVVGSADDSALPDCHAAAAYLCARGVRARVQVAEVSLPNRKVEQLASIFDVVKADVFVNVDSDVDLAEFDLDGLIAPLFAEDAAGASWAPAVEREQARTWGDAASMALLTGSLHAFPLLSQLDHGMLVGKVFAVRQDALRKVAGFGDLAEFLGEDFELARRLRRAGSSVVAVTPVAVSRMCGRTWPQAVARYTRWLHVIRVQQPWLMLSYPVLFFPTWLIVAAALLMPGSSQVAYWAIGLALVARIGVAVTAAAIAGRRSTLRELVQSVVLADVLLATAWVRALVTREVTWRGRAMRFDAHGRVILPREPRSLAEC